jgi:hypothetical protein
MFDLDWARRRVRWIQRAVATRAAGDALAENRSALWNADHVA